MLKLHNHFSTALQNYVQPRDTELHIPFDVARKLNTMEVGDHTYLSLVNRNGRSEVVKYTHTGQLTRGVITVERDVGRTGALNFPSGTCVKADLNTMAMDDYLLSQIEMAVAPLKAEIEKLKQAVKKKADK